MDNSRFVRFNARTFLIRKSAFEVLKRDHRLLKQFRARLNAPVDKQKEKIRKELYSLRLNKGNRALFAYDRVNERLIIHAVGSHDQVYRWLDRLRKVPELNIGQYLEIDDLERLKKIRHVEPHYHMDEDQREVKEKALSGKYGAIAVLGMPGSGKTLVLNKLAYDLITSAYLEDREPDFLYITFSRMLKDFVINQIIHHVEEDEERLTEDLRNQITRAILQRGWFLTFEEVVLQVAGELGINTKKYASIALSIETLANIRKYNKRFCKLQLSNFELVNLMNSEAIVDHSYHEHFLEKRLEKSGITPENVKLILELNEELDKYLWKNEGKKSFRILLKEVQERLDGKDHIRKSYLIIDERQDISNEVSDLILKMWNYDKNNEDTYWKKKIIISWDKRQFIIPTGSNVHNVDNWAKSLNAMGHDTKIELKKNYRNTKEIAKFANFFSEESDCCPDCEESNIEHEYTNASTNGSSCPDCEESNIPVRIVVGDLESTLKRLSEQLSEKENFEGIVGIIAPQEHVNTIEKALENKPVKVFKIEDVKGLEFSNVIIFDFLGITSHAEIESIDRHKWYVAVTRCRENLLIHFNNEEELRKLEREIFKGKLQEEMVEIGAFELINEFTEDLVSSEEDVWTIKLEQMKETLGRFVKGEDVEYEKVSNAIKTLWDGGYCSVIIEYYESNPNVWQIPELKKFLKIAATHSEYRRLYENIRAQLPQKDFSVFFKDLLLSDHEYETIEFVLKREDRMFALLYYALKSIPKASFNGKTLDIVEKLIAQYFEGKEKLLLTAELLYKKGDIDGAIETLADSDLHDRLREFYKNRLNLQEKKNLSERSKAIILHINTPKHNKPLKWRELQEFWQLYGELYGFPESREDKKKFLNRVRQHTSPSFYNTWTEILFIIDTVLHDLKSHVEVLKRRVRT